MQLGHALKEIGDYDGAEKAYREFLVLRPFDADIHFQLGHLFNKQNDLAAAHPWYEQASKLAPVNEDIAQHASMARQYVGRQDVSRKRARAMRLVSGEKWQEARPLLHEIVWSDGEEDLIGILANVTKETGAFEDAATLYEDYRAYALRSNPRLITDVEMQLGHLHKVMKDYPRALHHYLLARRSERQANGYVADDSIYECEINLCLNEIYTCFWLEK